MMLAPPWPALAAPRRPGEAAACGMARGQVQVDWT
jgi:hypothetical protein